LLGGHTALDGITAASHPLDRAPSSNVAENTDRPDGKISETSFCNGSQPRSASTAEPRIMKNPKKPPERENIRRFAALVSMRIVQLQDEVIRLTRQLPEANLSNYEDDLIRQVIGKTADTPGDLSERATSREGQARSRDSDDMLLGLAPGRGRRGAGGP
jgi:hypothetical protein